MSTAVDLEVVVAETSKPLAITSAELLDLIQHVCDGFITQYSDHIYDCKQDSNPEMMVSYTNARTNMRLMRLRFSRWLQTLDGSTTTETAVTAILEIATKLALPQRSLDELVRIVRLGYYKGVKTSITRVMAQCPLPDEDKD